jgi:hypothetical protein
LTFSRPLDTCARLIGHDARFSGCSDQAAVTDSQVEHTREKMVLDADDRLSVAGQLEKIISGLGDIASAGHGGLGGSSTTIFLLLSMHFLQNPFHFSTVFTIRIMDKKRRQYLKIIFSPLCQFDQNHA